MTWHPMTYRDLFAHSHHLDQDYDARLDTQLLVSTVVRAAKNLEGHRPWGKILHRSDPFRAQAFAVPS